MQAQTNVPYGYCHCGCGEKTRPSPYTDRPRGYIAGEPVRFITGHNARRPGHNKPRENVWVAEDRGYGSPCWIWQLAKWWNGYGVRRVNGKTHGAHRLAWEAVHGPIPGGLHIHHLCEQRDCVNPDHLELMDGLEHNRQHTLARYGRLDG